MKTSSLILKLDIAGNPTSWLSYEEAIKLYTNERVISSLGRETFVFKGGINAFTQKRSIVEVGSILLTRGRVHQKVSGNKFIPHLTNEALFRRDGHLCLYCGEKFETGYLTRDHVVPLSLGGRDNWENVVSACYRCNNLKGNKVLDEWGDRKLIAIPYVPNKAEYLYLLNRRIIADQQEFLALRFRKGSTLVENYTSKDFEL